MIFDISVDEFRKLGLNQVGFSDTRQENTRPAHNDEWFRAFYGIGAPGVHVMVKDLFDECDNDDLKLNRIFMMLHWLKTYGTEIQMSGYWKCNEKTVRTWVWAISKRIQKLKKKKVKLSCLFTCL
jgi:hypothetical protein